MKRNNLLWYKICAIINKLLLFSLIYLGEGMLYIISYLLFSFVFIGILFYLIEHSPSGWENESGFHTVKQQKQHAPQLSIDWTRSNRLLTAKRLTST